MTPDDLRFDREHLWHPYTSALAPLPCYPIAAAQGCELILDDGRRLVDGMSSWWSVIHGYNHPVLNAALVEQMENMSHVMFGGITHGPAVALGRLLTGMTPAPLSQVFLADSGSVAVEVALKQALQFWQGRGISGRHRFAAFEFGYHGDTFGAMSVTDPTNGMHSLFAGFLPHNLFLPAPPQGFTQALDQQVIDGWRAALSAHRQELAAVIVEPVVQGGGWHAHL
jgi:adenosylmethionine-8-amino-7-oxononanoate aminotransferase